MATIVEKTIYEADTSGLVKGTKEAETAFGGLQKKVSDLSGAIGVVGTIARGFGILELANVAVQGINFVREQAQAAVREIIAQQLLGARPSRLGGGAAPTAAALGQQLGDIQPGILEIGRTAVLEQGAIGQAAFTNLIAVMVSFFGNQEEAGRIQAEAMQLMVDALERQLPLLVQEVEDRQRAFDRTRGFEARVRQTDVPRLLGEIRGLTAGTDLEREFAETITTLNSMKSVIQQVRFLTEKVNEIREEVGTPFVLPEN